MNKIILIGNVTRDPELKTTTGNINYCNFGLAVPRSFNREETDFFNLIAWRQTADLIAEYVNKGDKIAIEGRVEISQYTDKEGNKRNSTNIVVDSIEFLTSKAEKKERVPYEKKEIAANPTKGKQVEISLEDLPF